MTFDEAYYETSSAAVPYVPTQKALALMEVGDEVLCFKEDVKPIRLWRIKAKPPVLQFDSRVTIQCEKTGEELDNVPVLCLLPTKYGILYKYLMEI